MKLQDILTYEASLKRYYSQKWQADRKEFQTVHKKKWWYYLPNVGWAFGLPTVTFGTSTLAQIDRDKVMMKGKLDGIDARAKYEYNEALLQLRTMHRIVVLEMEQFGYELQATKALESGIIKIHDDTFNDEKMKPLEHLQKSLEHERFVLQLKEKNKALVQMWLELEQFARYQMPEESLEPVAGETVDLSSRQ
ncbi:hypothetical protein ACS5NO_13740 [Larkinella sp. GY13]|uniref:hypothetical protein n=1 Tax=Larkinella sp. GY13 TaxID=3453720 RepID=UPI003EEABF9F